MPPHKILLTHNDISPNLGVLSIQHNVHKTFSYNRSQKAPQGIFKHFTSYALFLLEITVVPTLQMCSSVTIEIRLVFFGVRNSRLGHWVSFPMIS